MGIDLVQTAKIGFVGLLVAKWDLFFVFFLEGLWELAGKVRSQEEGARREGKLFDGGSLGAGRMRLPLQGGVCGKALCSCTY